MSDVIWKITTYQHNREKEATYIFKRLECRQKYFTNKQKELKRSQFKSKKRYEEKHARINDDTLLSLYYLEDDKILVIKLTYKDNNI